MKKTILILLLALMVSFDSFAGILHATVRNYQTEYQVTPVSRKGDRFRERANYRVLNQGERVEVLFVNRNEMGFRTENNDYGIARLYDFDIKRNDDNFWRWEWVHSLGAKDQFFNKKSLQKLRQKLNIESKAFEEELRNNHRILKNLTQDKYIKRLVRKIHPDEFLPTTGRPIRVHVLDTDYVQAFAMDNGNIYLSKAYIGSLRSENELIALLTQQIAHLYKNHNYQNFKKIRNHNLTSGIIAGAAVAGLGFTKHKTNLNWAQIGVISAGSFFLSKGVLELVGAKYRKEQKLEADQIAQKMLVKLNRNRHAMGDVLMRISNENFTPEKSGYFKQEFPNIHYRLAQLHYNGSAFKPYFANKFFMSKTTICRV